MKNIGDFKDITWNCRFHPTDWFHEVGCPHMKWSKKQLQEALNAAKQSNAYLTWAIINGGVSALSPERKQTEVKE